MSVGTTASVSRSSVVQTEVDRRPHLDRRSRRHAVRGRRRRDQGEERGSSGKRDRVVADGIPRHVRPYQHRLGKVFSRNDFPYRSIARIFSDARTWHLFLTRNGPSNRRPPKVSVWDLVPDLAVEVVSPTNSAVRSAKENTRVLRGRREQGLGHLSRAEEYPHLRLAEANPGSPARRRARRRRSDSGLPASTGRPLRGRSRMSATARLALAEPSMTH